MTKTEVVFHGALAEVVGKKVWHLLVASPAEALALVNVNVNGRLFKHLALNSSPESGAYRVVLDGADFGIPDQLGLPRTYKKIEFVPVVAGSGADSAGTWMVVLGVVLILAAVVTAGASSAGLAGGASFFTGATTASAYSGFTGIVLTLGIGLTLSGISAMLAPSPKEKREDKASKLFSGAVNNTKAGNPVPVGYGLLIIGSQAISQGVHNTPRLPKVTPPSI